tara:strand:- start:1262 stop:2458 length:1197 start_codon:yes stop_codon:yes gene_type:complete
MIKRFRFTNERIRALPANSTDSKSTDLEVSDIDVIGLKCLSGKGHAGSKRFLLRYVFESRKRSIGIGRFPDIDVATARKIARRYKSMIAEGIDPKAEKESYKAQPTVSEFFWNTYLPLIKKQKRTWPDDVQRYRDYCEPVIGYLKYTDLNARQVQQLQLDLSGPIPTREAYANSTCNRAIAVLKTMGNHAVRLGVVDVNEAAKIRLLKEDNARTRFLDIDEVRLLIKEARQLSDKSIGGYIVMLALSGCRASEIRDARHQNLDCERRTLFVPRTKNGRSRVVYLSDLALEVLAEIPKVAGNPFIFTGRLQGRPLSDCRTTFRNCLLRAGVTDVENVCFHTLRHSAASNMVSAGFSLNDVKEQLSHQSIISSQRYAKTTSTRLIQTNDHISRLLSGQQT